eukprot:11829636-Alexandrium_andersonii.AAC.1
MASSRGLQHLCPTGGARFIAPVSRAPESRAPEAGLPMAKPRELDLESELLSEARWQPPLG